MNLKSLFCAIIAVFIPTMGQAQQAPGSGSFQIRAVLHDPVNPVADLYLPDQAGQVVKLKLVGEGLSDAQGTTPSNGSLVLYNKQVIDPKNPGASLAASVKIPEGMKRAIIVVVPAPADSKPAYRMLLIDDSPGAFPGGESRVISLVAFEAALQAGEHKLPLKPASITKVPAVKQANEFNMAQTNFYFKALNDKHGHSAGDLLLVEVASRLKGCVREIDTVARFGGDEFVVLLDELALGQEESKAQAGVIAEKIRLALAAPYTLAIVREGADAVTLGHRCTASIGVTLFIHSEASQEDILMRADAAMYQAKEQGRDRVQFYASKAEAGADDVLVPG
jgi:diguanylate cyclase (GGDEF)-like protein